MYNRSKVKDLMLTCYADGTHNCSKALGLDNCDNFLCDECVERYSDKHYELICKIGKFDCADCKGTQITLGIIDTIECSECHKIIKEYIKEDFVDIFNRLSDNYVE